MMVFKRSDDCVDRLWKSQVFLTNEFDADYSATSPNNLARLSSPVNEGKFELVRNKAGSVRDNLCSILRDIHDFALSRRLTPERNPSGLTPNSSDFPQQFFSLH
jgi:hypothetical protein